MSLDLLKQQRDGLLCSMYNEGLLDQQFDQLLALQDADSPGFIEEVIKLFCQDSERILGELTKHMSQPVVDYTMIDAYVHQLKGSSASVGAQLVKCACINFRQACEENDKEGCMLALNMINNEYYHVRSKFEIMIQLEQRILAYSPKHQ
ncbi:hypothetical protein Syun_016495 [Stephania yunnanensis]|uniref:Histidine-containing phosphotransfer protein n=1 Tax=Stephania yunnanensis TaxID=152371 RepID=A0AAP0J7E9_9MAGN